MCFVSGLLLLFILLSGLQMENTSPQLERYHTLGTFYIMVDLFVSCFTPKCYTLELSLTETFTIVLCKKKKKKHYLIFI